MLYAHSDMVLAAVYSQQGKFEQAFMALQEARKQAREGSRVLSWLVYVHGQRGRKKRALTIAGELEALSQSRYVCPLDIARVYVGVGNKDRTLTYLEQAAEQRCGRLISAIVDPTYDLVRSEPRFAALRSRMNLP